MTKKPDWEIYRNLLRWQAEKLRTLAQDIRDPKVRDRFEQLALDIGGEGQNYLN
jgi:hypothetical protein